MTPKNQNTGAPKRVEAIDKIIGMKVRAYRMLKGISQEKLAEKLGITFQQIQKYERGSNRISVSRLFHIAEALGTPVEAFLSTQQPSPGFAEDKQEDFVPEKKEPDKDLLNNKETLQLIKAYYAIESTQARKDLMSMIKTYSKNVQNN